MLKAGVAPAALGLALIAAPAFAQDAAPQADAAEEADTGIVVTGSLIKNPNLVQANPVNVTTSEEIQLRQTNVAEQVLRQIPGVVPSIGSAVNNGNGGASFVNLRGIGSNRNIVLLDGDRIAPADLLGRVDLNNIPLALVSRVDALTGGAVTTYGADAISGVVNFITKKNFAGVEVSGSQSITQRGDGNYARIDATIGGNFDDGRGNAVLGIGYQKSDPVYQGARDFSNFSLNSFSGASSGSGTGVPSRVSGTRPLTAAGAINLLPAFAVTGTTANGTPILTPVDGGIANGGVRQINIGRAGVAGGGVDGSATAGNYAPFNFNPFNIFQTPFKRYNFYAKANYEISDAIEIYTRAIFSKNTVNTIIAPSGSFGGTVTVNLNNPFLPTPLRNQLCAFNIAPNTVGVSPTGAAVSAQTTYTPRFTTAECAAAAQATGPTDARYRTVTVTLNRRTTEIGPRLSEFTTTIFDYRLGVRGAINSHINYDVNGSYGESENLQTIQNYTLQSRFRQALLTNNGTTCQDPSNGCVPVNVFGPEGTISQAAGAFLSQASTTRVKTSLVQARAVVSGDLGFASPAGETPLGFALGTEYRKYTARQASDLLAKTPGELGGAGGAAPDINGAYDVWEGFGELIAPLVEDKPLFKSLTLELGGRYSRYTVQGGGQTSAYTYKSALSWEPVSDVKFRGNYARAVRAPNINELFSPITTGLTNLAADPCAGAAPVANANLRAVCIAQGAPAGTIGSITQPTAGQANSTGGGNLNLRPEKADTITAGVVIQPSMIPNFSLSLDYYRILVRGAVTTATPGDAISSCFGSLSAASATNPACTIIRRNPITGGLDGDPATTAGLFQPLSNLGRLKTSGLDLIANYSKQFGKVKYSMSFVGNYTIKSKFKATPSSLNRECVGFVSINCGSLQPKYQWTMRNTLGYGKVDVSVQWRHIDSMVQEPDDITNPNGSGPAFAGNLPSGIGSISGRAVDFGKIGAYDYFDLTTRFEATDNITFVAGIDNLFDKKPPIVGNTLGSTSFNSGNTYPSTYDALGRTFRVTANVKF